MESSPPSPPATSAVRPVSTRSSAWAPLKMPIFRGLWIANIVSNVGTTMNDTAAVWTMTGMSQSPLLITLMQTMSSLPLFLLALPAGALADLVDRRKVILAAQVGSLLTAVGMALLATFGTLTPAILLLATFQLGVASAFTLPAWQAMIPEIVGRTQLTAALGLGSVGFNLARALGPVLGGLLVSMLGPGPVFTLNAVSYAGVLWAVWQVRAEKSTSTVEQERMLGAMTAALRYASHAPAMKAVMLRVGLHVFAAVAPVALLPILIKARSGTGVHFGAFMGCYGFGAILMALFVLPRLRQSWSFDRVISWAALGSAISILCLALAPYTIVMGAALALAGASWMSALNTFNVAAQSAFPNWVRARSSAIYLVVVQGAFALGALAWGRMLHDLGATVALCTSAVMLIGSALAARWRPISHLAALDLTPANHWREHALVTEPGPEDGPVLITVSYSIDPAQAAEFRAAMELLREIRLRDGAYRCSLFVDLNDPTHYRETYLVGSWVEHLRQHRRETVDDRRIKEAVLAFHRGQERPKVSHLLMVEQ